MLLSAWLLGADRLVTVFVPLTLASLGAVVAAYRALASEPYRVPERPSRMIRHPVLLMNPESGDGKVEQQDLVSRARDRGAEVILLDADADVQELARRAVSEGADLLGVAGGDGTQALVAEVAIEHDLPFLVIPAGTRNHFAMDLGLDRRDAAAALEALGDGVEVSVDVAYANDRIFVNNVSLGVYAEAVQDPSYREEKARTVLRSVTESMGESSSTDLVCRIPDGTEVKGPQAILISNNPYDTNDVVGMGRRYRIDGGRLGVVVVRLDDASDAAAMIANVERGALDQAAGVWRWTTEEITVASGAADVPSGVDGEALSLASPVRCTIRPRALRVLVPRERPGVPAPSVSLRWRRVRELVGLAAGTSPNAPHEPEGAGQRP